MIIKKDETKVKHYKDKVVREVINNFPCSQMEFAEKMKSVLNSDAPIIRDGDNLIIEATIDGKRINIVIQPIIPRYIITYQLDESERFTTFK